MIEAPASLIPVEELIEKIKTYLPGFDEVLLRKAYDFGKEKHGTQFRHSGEPYFAHPIAVAEILIEQKLDLETIITALLHDVIEDTAVTSAEIEKLFGPSIVFLVEGVTKLAKVKLKPDKVQDAENFRKFILAAAVDLRVIIVKLADRLHNMRTLAFHPVAATRRRKAVEVMEVYAPLAERIGMNRLKDELELLAFEHTDPEAFIRIQKHLATIREEGHDLISPILDELKSLAEEHGIHVSVAGREKTPPSIWLKMQRKGVSFDRIFDIMAFRYIAESVTDCYRLLGLVHGQYSMIPGRFKDYISTPKPNGYQSIHTSVLGAKNTPIEIQIRTYDMHQVAEFGVAAHWVYKEQGKDSAGKPQEWLNSLVDSIEKTQDIEELLEYSKLATFKDAVFCFSPNGDLIDLAYGSTALDFAYAIHSDVGNKCVGAKVNKRIVSLSTPLFTGDQVEILTSKTQEPTLEWLEYVKTSKAKTYIRRYLRQQKFEDMVVLGRHMLKLIFEQNGFRFVEKDVARVLPILDYDFLEDLYAQVGEGLRTPDSVLIALYPEKKSEDKKSLKLEDLQTRERKEKPSSQTSLSGISVKFAGCCHPLPGDSILGVIYTGSGITIHERSCPELKKWQHQTPDHIIEVQWGHVVSQSDVFFGRLKIMSEHKQGSLNAITQILAANQMRLHDIHVLSRSMHYIEFMIDIEVKAKEDLDHLIQAMRMSSDIVNVERI